MPGKSPRGPMGGCSSGQSGMGARSIELDNEERTTNAAKNYLMLVRQTLVVPEAGAMMMLLQPAFSLVHPCQCH
jgi:hypothetical protein